MKKAIVILSIFLVVVFFAGCYTTTAYTFGGVTDNAAIKVAEGPSADGATAAARSGGISKIATIDYRTTETHWIWLAWFGIPTKVKVEQTVIVSGE